LKQNWKIKVLDMKISALSFWILCMTNQVFARSFGDSKSLVRVRRQFGFGFPRWGNQNYGQSSAQANANAFNNYFNPNGGFGSSNANAQAQSFDSQGPLGSFGASAANSNSQGFQFGPGNSEKMKFHS
jgi:hypothetical protein